MGSVNDNQPRWLADVQERSRRIMARLAEQNEEEARNHPDGPAGWLADHDAPAVVRRSVMAAVPTDEDADEV